MVFQAQILERDQYMWMLEVVEMTAKAPCHRADLTCQSKANRHLLSDRKTTCYKKNEWH